MKKLLAALLLLFPLVANSATPTGRTWVPQDCGNGTFSIICSGGPSIPETPQVGFSTPFTPSTACDVTSLADSGAGTLRACAEAGDQYVTKSVAGTITLTSNIILGAGTFIDGLASVGGQINVEKGGTYTSASPNPGGLVVQSGVDNVFVQGVYLKGLWDETTSHSDNASPGFSIDGDGSNVNNVTFYRSTLENIADAAISVWCNASNITFNRIAVIDSFHPTALSCGADDSQQRTNIALMEVFSANNDDRAGANIRRNTDNGVVYNTVVHEMNAYGFGVAQAGFRFRCDTTTTTICPDNWDLIGNHVTSSANTADLQQSLVFQDSASPLEVFDSLNRWPTEETDSGTAVSAHNGGTVPYVFKDPINVVADAGTGVDSGRLATLKAQATAQIISDRGLTNPNWWIPQPERQCTALVNAGNVCNDGTLFCPTSVAEIQTMHDDSRFGDGGDALCLRAGSFGIESAGEVALLTKNAANRTSFANSDRLHFGHYPDETVTLRGASSHTQAIWDDATAATPAGTVNGQFGIVVQGDGWRVNADNGRMNVEYLSETGIVVAGDYVDIIGVNCRYIWAKSPDGCVTIGLNAEYTSDDDEGTSNRPDVQGTRILLNKFAHIYHGTAINVHADVSNAIDIVDAEIKQNAIMYAGYEPDFDRVPIIGGDPQGGGNSDAVGTRVQCIEQSTQSAVECYDIDISDNFMYWTADDCLDVQGEGLRIWNNVGEGCGPAGTRGVKDKTAQSTDFAIVGNLILHGDVGALGDERGLEMRYSSASLGTRTVAGNTIVDFASQGYLLSGTTIETENNAAYLNGTNFQGWPTASTDLSAVAGDFESPATTFVAPLTSEFDNTSLTNAELIWGWMKVRLDAFEPTLGGNLYEAGSATGATMPNGSQVYCARADDDANPYPSNDASCKHWLGSAPDIGAVERGLY